ncbi:MAG: hypothetical protein EOO10_20660 [Chitinophagaceae bacterium]|nr:MAG: hypothetical protein EOO10_20660 [Chitinophagaceae bacterium]
MKKQLLLFVGFLVTTAVAYAQSDSANTVSDQIKKERGQQQQQANNSLKMNDSLIAELNNKLANIDAGKTKERLKAVEELQSKLSDRLQLLEEAPKFRTQYNGQLAFMELLSIQRDIQPANLFSSSQAFFEQLGSVSRLQSYSDFTAWKTQFDTWYQGKTSDASAPFVSYVNNALSFVSRGAQQIPLYGSFVNTAISGIGTLFASFGNGKKDKDLVAKTPQVLNLLNALSQFEQQKAILDHEWELINVDLAHLQDENKRLIAEQLVYFGLDSNTYKREYLKNTLDSKRESYKNSCREQIKEKLLSLDANKTTKNEWRGEIETFMYKVQSLRTRFGVLTSKMLTNIDRYNDLISYFAKQPDFPAQFTENVRNLNTLLNNVRSNFVATFNPARYIEDSAVMYVDSKTSSY